MMLIDQLMPAYEHFERHQTLINASHDAVWRAVREVTPREIALFILLTTIRGLGRSRETTNRPLLDVARAGGFFDLASNDDELVLGTVGQFWRLHARECQQDLHGPEDFRAFQRPGFAKAAINFHSEERDGAIRLTTETRITTTDAPARRRFALYWTFIHPGSAVIRRMWLRAIRMRAEGIIRPT